MVDAVPLEKFYCLAVVRTVDGQRAPALRPADEPGGSFPSGSTIAFERRTVRETMRRVWTSAAMCGFEVVWHRPPVLHPKHPWISPASPHGDLLADRAVSRIPTGLLRHQRYSSESIYLTVDIPTDVASRETTTIDAVVPHRVGIQVGRVVSVATYTKTASWRAIQTVEAEPALGGVRDRLVHDLAVLP